MIATAGMRLKLPKIRSNVFPARGHQGKPGWKAAYKDSCSLTYHFHMVHHSIPESAQEKNSIKIANPSEHQFLLVRYALY